MTVFVYKWEDRKKEMKNSEMVGRESYKEMS